MNCRWCGNKAKLQQKTCSRHCYMRVRLLKTLSYFGFNHSALASQNAELEFTKITDKIKFEYFDKQKSLQQICDEYNLPDAGTLGCFFVKSLGVKLRAHNESNSVAIQSGRKRIGIPKLKYKSGRHTSWSGNNFWYRSSYELRYFKILDELRVNYIAEPFAIKYFDFVRQKIRGTIPDIYLPDSNTIVEIKSTYTYDRENMKCKFDAYKKLGYKCLLVLEFKEYNDVV